MKISSRDLFAELLIREFNFRGSSLGKERKDNFLLWPIETLFISNRYFEKTYTRTINCLHSYNIYYIANLVIYSEEELLKIPNFGEKHLGFIKYSLCELGLALNEENLFPIPFNELINNINTIIEDIKPHLKDKSYEELLDFYNILLLGK